MLFEANFFQSLPSGYDTNLRKKKIQLNSEMMLEAKRLLTLLQQCYLYVVHANTKLTEDELCGV